MSGTTFEAWLDPLTELCDAIRERTRAAIAKAARTGTEHELARPVAQGVGDVTFGLDLPAETWIAEWLERTARRTPLSLLTEDSGWKHRGPTTSGRGPAQLDGFDHGGPRIAIDPIDGTRNLMCDLRSAWTVVSFAPPGPAMPRFGDLSGGIVSELATSRVRGFHRYLADGVTCTRESRGDDGALEQRCEVRVDDDDRVDHGYFPFFRYEPALRPAIATLEARFFERLRRLEGADLRSCYDDQYISNAGQMVLLANGAYRMVVDPRSLVGVRAGRKTVTAKPYDVGGAFVCAASAGAALTRADGGVLDFPIDAETPVDFAGYANARTRARLEPHWLATLAD